MSQKVEHNRTQIKSPTKTPSTRRRNQHSHQAILKAASELLEEKGYGGVCIEAIASRAAVGKQTIYRWWSSKAAVIMEAYAAQATSNIPTPNTGSVREDLCNILQQLFELLTKTPTGAAISGLIAEAQIDPEVAEVFHERFVQGRRQATRIILERGIARSELRSDLNLELAIDAIFGPIWYRLLLKHAPLDDAFAEELVNLAMVGLQV
ncbi:TetR family transcriptional regulator [Scytonema sp. UIC 10036]|uniref:TetR/AcrR family transcriptional regulator n=1 Tax=Scytonema sp. UIC 10036 TaxID=2304196 RepID=UPI0012DA49C8|nr:TetR/AcrR family transcriptional regulator [Scytonema sp. UIC 10036]MUG97274.1 TetR family transcriptional regulator [Scytonema sp. UIC 10036]